MRDAEQASTKALLQIQSLAKDALLNLEHYVSDDELIEAIQLKKSSRIFSSDKSADKSTDSTNVEMESNTVIEVINAMLPDKRNGEYEILQSLTHLGSHIPGITGCAL